MYDLWVRLMFLAAIVQLGISLKDVRDCRARECRMRKDKAIRKVLVVDWKPISVFPEEAKRFR